MPNYVSLWRFATLLVGVPLLACAPDSSTALAPEGEFRTDEHPFRLITLATGLEHPWGMAFLPNGGILITERPGRLRLYSGGEIDPRPIQGLPKIATTGQGGLLDVTLDPAFPSNSLVYLSYAAGGPKGVGTEVLRARLDDHRLNEPEVIFRALPKSRGGRHFGSRLLFSRGGKLLITLGDRGERPQAQNLQSHPGSIIRLDPDGGIPDDNPFRGQPGSAPEIYTFGNRNVQGIALRPENGQIWAHEHGPRGGDELNILAAGNNYGWPVITYGRNYGTGTQIGEGERKQGMVQPVHHWVPSIAPSGMSFYTGEAFPRWRGDVFLGSLKFELLVRLRLDGERVVTEERLLEGIIGRIRDVRTGPDGFIYLLSDAGNGGLFRLEPLP